MLYNLLKWINNLRYTKNNKVLEKLAHASHLFNRMLLASSPRLKFLNLKHTYLQRYGLAINDIFISANGRNETIHFTETVIGADLSILLETKDCIRECNSLARRDREASRGTRFPARLPSTRRTDALCAGETSPCRETRSPWLDVWIFTHARGYGIPILVTRNCNQRLRRKRAGEQNIQKTRR